MSLVKIPVEADPYEQEFTIDLDGTVYTLHFAFNSRLNKWSMDIADEFKNAIVNGIVLLSGIDLLQSHKDVRLPIGKFFIWDTSNQDSDPDDTTLGGTVQLLYSAVNS